ncbi:MAG: hypothetical protein KC486_33960 [Myxococcales bacterium]|nr:hypothetical protein [Myxococcales bacterium]
MDADAIDAVLSQGRVALLRAFDAFLRESGLVALRRRSFPIFQVNVKKRRFLLQVSCTEVFTPAEHGLVVEEAKGGPLLVRVDPESGERRVILSITPRSHPVFQAHASFTAPSDVVIDSLGDAAALRGALEAGALAINEAWREELEVAGR